MAQRKEREAPHSGGEMHRHRLAHERGLQRDRIENGASVECGEPRKHAIGSRGERELRERRARAVQRAERAREGPSVRA